MNTASSLNQKLMEQADFDPEREAAFQAFALLIDTAHAHNAKRETGDSFLAVIELQARKGGEETLQERVDTLRSVLALDEDVISDPTPSVQVMYDYIRADALVEIKSYAMGHNRCREITKRVRKKWKPGRGNGIIVGSSFQIPAR